MSEIKPVRLDKTYFGKIAKINEEAKTIDVLVSTSTKDRDGDIVEPKAFRKHIKTYETNPVLLSSHAHTDLRKIIGKAESIKITKDGLKASFKYFVDEGNEEADWAFKLATKNIGAFSVGFIGRDWEDLEPDPKGTPMERMFGGRKFTEVELLEISQVTVPANPDATIRNSYTEEESKLYEMACKAFGWSEDEHNHNESDNQEPEEKEVVKETEEIKMQKEILREIVELKSHLVKDFTSINEALEDLNLRISELEDKKNEDYIDVLFSGNEKSNQTADVYDFDEIKGAVKSALKGDTNE